MKLICNRGALLEALSIVGTVVPSRSPKPQLSCIRLTAVKGEGQESDRLELAATDLEVAITYSDVQVQVDQPGVTLVPADKLRDIVRESIDDTLTITLIGEQAEIKGSDSRFKIYTQLPEHFPPVPGYGGEGAESDMSVAGGLLRQLIGQVLFAAAKEGTRYAFNGVRARAKGGKLGLVSTDGRRMAMVDGAVHGELPGAGGAAGAIIPAKTLNLVDKLIGDPEESVGIKLTDNQIIFHTPSATLTSVLVEGQFPPVDDVIPKDSDKKMTASTSDLLSAVRRASLLTSDQSKGVRMEFEDGNLRLSSRNAEEGEAEVNFPCKYEGSKLEIGFNPQYLTDALKVVDADEVTLELSAANRPGLLRAGESFQYVIMPVNLQ